MNKFLELELDDVISTDTKIDEVFQAPTFRIKEFKANLLSKLSINLKSWLGEGMPCQMLRPGQGWQSGTVKILLVFEPDEVTDKEFDELRMEKTPNEH